MMMLLAMRFRYRIDDWDNKGDHAELAGANEL